MKFQNWLSKQKYYQIEYENDNLFNFYIKTRVFMSLLLLYSRKLLSDPYVTYLCFPKLLILQKKIIIEQVFQQLNSNFL